MNATTRKSLKVYRCPAQPEIQLVEWQGQVIGYLIRHKGSRTTTHPYKAFVFTLRPCPHGGSHGDAVYLGAWYNGRGDKDAPGIYDFKAAKDAAIAEILVARDRVLDGEDARLTR
jgi:hypothetical protein